MEQLAVLGRDVQVDTLPVVADDAGGHQLGVFGIDACLAQIQLGRKQRARGAIVGRREVGVRVGADGPRARHGTELIG